MKINYSKKIKGLCYVENVLNEKGIKISKVIFDNNCKLIEDANAYLRELRITRTSSYNSINRIAYDLCYFFDFLVFTEKTVSEIDYDFLSTFIEYLMKINKGNREYSIEKTLLTSMNTENINSKVVKIRKFGVLVDKSIDRIFNRAIDYMEFLKRENKFNKIQLLGGLKTYKDRKRFIRANGIQTSSEFVEQIDDNKLITAEQISLIKNYASRKNDYQRFLYFILEVTGMRIGEALGLKVDLCEIEDIRSIKGDICFKNNIWKIKVKWDQDNPNDSLSKTRNTRTISIADKDRFEFESLFERYIKYRKIKLKLKVSEGYWLFISNRGTKLSYDTASKRFKRTLNIVCPEAGNISYHSYRHTFATNKILEGHPLELIALIMGHSSPLVTYKTYIHYGGENMKEIRQKYSHYTKKLLKIEGDRHGTYK